jgi:hypothetical protein
MATKLVRLIVEIYPEYGGAIVKFQDKSWGEDSPWSGNLHEGSEAQFGARCEAVGIDLPRGFVRKYCAERNSAIRVKEYELVVLRSQIQKLGFGQAGGILAGTC